MKDLQYLIQNFFTHKDYLAPADQIPGTLFTPLHFAFAAVLAVIVAAAVIQVARHPRHIKPTFIGLWIAMAVWEVVIVAWDSMAGIQPGLDLQTNLSLYPCSLYLYTMPFIIWGKGLVKRMACGYMCTLGLLGGAINFFYPAIQLSSYSCISFMGFHTFFFHAALVFTCAVLLVTGEHRYTHVNHWWELFLPCVFSLALSIPANIVNYSHINADYMYFRGEFPIVAAIFGNTPDIVITAVLYLLYIFIPMIFYLPSYIHGKIIHREPAAV